MSSKKINRALYGPSWMEVIFGAVLSFGLGVVAAGVFLVLKPIERVKEMPKEPDARTIYYVEGTRDAAKARGSVAKRQAIVAGTSGSISLNEDELNTFFPANPEPAAAAPGKGAAPKAGAPKTPPPAPPKAPTPAKGKDGQKAPEPAAAPAAPMFAAASPNFHFVDGKLQVALPTTLNALGLSQAVTILATGDFVKESDAFTFEADKFYVGSLLANRIPFFKRAVMKKVMSSQAVPEDLAAAWAKLSDVKVEGASLKLTLP